MCKNIFKFLGMIWKREVGNSRTVSVQIFKYQEQHRKLKLNLKLSLTVHLLVNQGIIYWTKSYSTFVGKPGNNLLDYPDLF